MAETSESDLVVPNGPRGPGEGAISGDIAGRPWEPGKSQEGDGTEGRTENCGGLRNMHKECGKVLGATKRESQITEV